MACSRDISFCPWLVVRPKGPSRFQSPFDIPFSIYFNHGYSVYVYILPLGITKQPSRINTSELSVLQPTQVRHKSGICHGFITARPFFHEFIWFVLSFDSFKASTIELRCSNRTVAMQQDSQSPGNKEEGFNDTHARDISISSQRTRYVVQ